jgi:hypothetical protein
LKRRWIGLLLTIAISQATLLPRMKEGGDP